MPRPRKRRRIGCEPDYNRFGPKGIPIQGSINLTLEELETIKLIDLNNMTQEECAKSMGVARTTVTSIYNDARRKIATAIIEGKTLIIEGGNYIISK